MIHEQVKHKLVTPASGVLVVLMAAGVVAAVIRFATGLGASTNLTDQYPWGLWIAVDVMSGIALAAGGFTTAALVYLFGGQKYHALVRPAILTGLLGYVFVAIGLLIDLGLPWRIWHPIIMWPEHSAMFEVAWCVMLYLTVLILEFAPAVCQRFGWTNLENLWRKLAPVFSIAAVAFFVGIMSHSWTWAIVVLVFLAILAVVLPGAPASRPGAPVLLIIAGVIFSTMHQSSLGTLFLLMRDKLDPLWWTPSLPINFFLSAVAVGFAMVIFETTLSAKAFKRPMETEALAGMGRILGYALWIYLAYRVIDLFVRGQLNLDPADDSKTNLFLLEMILGTVVPAVILSSAKARHNTGLLFLAALLVVLGVVFNRINVAWLAMTMPGEGTYAPSILEVIITISMISTIVLFFTLAVKLLPVFGDQK